MSAFKKKSNDKILRKLFKLLYKNSKLVSITSLIVLSLVGLATAASTLFKQWFFEAVSALSDGGALSTAIFWGIFLAVFMALTLVINGASDVMLENLGIKLSGYLGRAINKKAQKVDLICYENPEMLDTINKAYEGVANSGELLGIMVINITFYVPYFLFFFIYLFSIEPMLCIGILLIFASTVIGMIVRAKYFGNLEDAVAPVRRRMTYYERCLVDKEYAKETRLLGAVWFFRQLYEVATLLFKKEQWKARLKANFIDLGLRLITLVVYIIILSQLYYYMSIEVINTSIFAAVMTSIDRMFGYMDYIGYSFGQMSMTMPSVKNTMKFLDLPERDGIDVSIDEYDITLKDVSFAYPTTTVDVLKNVDLTIKKGETIAIVGENGAGKSTLVKILMSLYLPTGGEVFFGEYNTKDISPSSAVSSMSAVFQKYQRYKMKVSDNVYISDTTDPLDHSKLNIAMEKADLDIEGRSFTDGIDTMVSREFNGIELSGGQWQRIALGRGFYRNHSMIVLDEPTAAIDPIEETRIYKKFAELAKDKTAIIVTHRLGSAKIANRIIVMEDGKIVDIGTHDQLISRDGLYSHMYTSQAKWYA